MKKLLILFLPLVFIANEGCLDIPDDIIAPQWDVELNLPLMKRFYKLHEIIKTQDYISLDDDSTYVVTSDEYYQTSNVSNFIEVAAENSNTGNVVSAATPGTEIFLEFPEGAKLEEATFEKGTLKFKGVNQSLLAQVTLTIDVPGILTIANLPLQVVLTIPANGTTEETIDLKDHKYDEPANQSNFFKGLLWIKAKATSTDPTATALFDAYNSDFLFVRAKGYLPTKSLGLLNNTFDLKVGDASDFRDKVLLGGAILSLKAVYHSNEEDPFPIEIRDLIITAKRADGTTKRMMEKDPATGAIIGDKFTFKFEGGVIDTSFTELNSTVTEFLSFLPDSVLLDAEYIMNPDNDPTYHVALKGDSINFVTSFTSRLSNNKASLLSLKQSTVIQTDSLEFSDDDREQIANGQLAALTLNVESFLPVTSSLHILLLDKNEQPLFVVKNSSGSDTLTFNGGEINTTTGRVSASVITNQTISLNADEILKLSKAYYAIVTTGVRTKGALDPDPPKVALRANDWIRINVSGHLNYRIKEKE